MAVLRRASEGACEIKPSREVSNVNTTLVAPDVLSANLDHEDWAIVDCRFSLQEPEQGEAEYLEGHIPEAVYAHLDRDLSGPMTGNNGRHPLPDPEQLVDRFSAWGIDDEVQVVAYDATGGQYAARLWWTLRYLGHDAVAVLDGGLAAWTSAGLPVSKERKERRRRSFTARPDREMRIGIGALEAARPRTLLLDARAPERFRGETEPLDPVAGHIPGARNHPTALNLGEDGRFLSSDILRERFEQVLGERDAGSVISYCGSGVTACHNLLAMEVAGLHGARLYPGSWSEWCADPSRPVETGPESE